MTPVRRHANLKTTGQATRPLFATLLPPTCQLRPPAPALLPAVGWFARDAQLLSTVGDVLLDGSSAAAKPADGWTLLVPQVGRRCCLLLHWVLRLDTCS